LNFTPRKQAYKLSIRYSNFALASAGMHNFAINYESDMKQKCMKTQSMQVGQKHGPSIYRQLEI
jgi:hypothetical protein